jgi:hypothetical protein
MSSAIPGPESQTPLPLPSVAPAPAGGSGAGRNPFIAAGLGFLFPGLGQIANGQISKALVIFMVFFGSITVMVNHENPLPWAFFLPLAYFYGIVDAFRSAALSNARQQGLFEEDGVEGPGWGVTLIGLGVLLLLNNLGWLNLASVARYWPLLLILAGGLMLKSSLAKRHKE